MPRASAFCWWLKKRHVVEGQLWSYKEKDYVNLDQIRKQDYDRQWRKAQRMYPYAADPFVERLEKDEVYLMQIVLRDAFSQAPDRQSPLVQKRAIQVAERLGVLAQIYAYYSQLVGANGFEVAVKMGTEVAEMHTKFDSIPIFAVVLTLFLGIFTFMCFKWLFTGQKVKTTRDIGVQSQTTYTAIRGSTNPRFHPLPDESHGAFF